MRGLAAAALLLAAACLHGAPTPAPGEGAWPRIRDRHTRAAKLYDGLSSLAFASATWESPEIRAARVERVAAWKVMTAQERAALQAAEDAAAVARDEFTVSLFTTDRPDNDLDASRSSWRIALVRADGTEALPTRVEQVRPDALLRTLYPQIGDFDVVYRVSFAKLAAPLAPPFTLRIAGPRGRLDFAFTADGRSG